MKNICPHMLTFDGAALLGLGILILLICVCHAQQRCYRLFSLSCSEMEGGKKKQRKKRIKRVFSAESTIEHRLQESSSNERVGRGPSLPGVPPFSHPLKDTLFFPNIQLLISPSSLLPYSQLDP